MSLKKPDIYGLREKHTQRFEVIEGQDRAADLALWRLFCISLYTCLLSLSDCDLFEVGDQEIYLFIHSLTIGLRVSSTY